ncbi:DnaJ domain-containing protein [Cryptosporidium muris RN66]|uniref:DnaJ domain-containing protein n=1 Tax=Cryptosporidium muris (strain RN66) TaxID=441375 RepID=B6AHY8_CRYMR|nr:DnaJ domain-containing protein [Cryptosporidium muris RN66]EEA07829.1 DnaJ domain-containing protein [Cryptosporidium muris RN66]|eukprot:XP_002142178.1 DnaJ domain-containing protein [Cryptosporidium muris RN66]
MNVSEYCNAYRTLGIQIGCSFDIIKTAYRRRARDIHPDKNPDKDKLQAHEDFTKLQKSYELLSNESGRKQFEKYWKVYSSQRELAQRQRDRTDELKRKYKCELYKKEKRVTYSSRSSNFTYKRKYNKEGESVYSPEYFNDLRSQSEALINAYFQSSDNHSSYRNSDIAEKISEILNSNIKDYIVQDFDSFEDALLEKLLMATKE